MKSETSASAINEEESWVERRVREARTSHAIPDAAAEQLRELLYGQLAQRPLRPPEQTEAAKRLLASIEPVDTKTTPPVS
jgi:hypothetical protein